MAVASEVQKSSYNTGTAIAFCSGLQCWIVDDFSKTTSLLATSAINHFRCLCTRPAGNKTTSLPQTSLDFAN